VRIHENLNFDIYLKFIVLVFLIKVNKKSQALAHYFFGHRKTILLVFHTCILKSNLELGRHLAKMQKFSSYDKMLVKWKSLTYIVCSFAIPLINQDSKFFYFVVNDWNIYYVLYDV
jgi:hypothetical protein